MKNKLYALIFSAGIAISGFVVTGISSGLDEVFPYLALSFLSLILFYHEKPENIRNRRMFGIVPAWLFLVYATFDASRPWADTHYDITLPPVFDVAMIFVIYPLGYLFGYLWGIAKRDLWDKD